MIKPGAVKKAGIAAEGPADCPPPPRSEGTPAQGRCPEPPGAPSMASGAQPARARRAEPRVHWGKAEPAASAASSPCRLASAGPSTPPWGTRYGDPHILPGGCHLLWAEKHPHPPGRCLGRRGCQSKEEVGGDLRSSPAAAPSRSCRCLFLCSELQDAPSWNHSTILGSFRLLCTTAGATSGAQAPHHTLSPADGCGGEDLTLPHLLEVGMGAALGSQPPLSPPTFLS